MTRIKALCFLLLACALCTSAAAQVPQTRSVPFNRYFYNPLLDNAADPWVVREGEYYYYCRSAPEAIEITRSPTLTGIAAYRQHAASVTRVPALQGQTDIWAPELHYYQGRWYLYYTADYDKNNLLHRMYVIQSEGPDPLGDWGAPVKLDLPKDQYAIDGTFFKASDGRIFHIWSGFKSEAEGLDLVKQNLYIAELAQGDPTQVITTRRVMIGEPRYAWEKSVYPINEGPAILTSPAGTVYCMYAADFSGSDLYKIGAIRLGGQEPMKANSWRKLEKPVLASNEEAGIYAPGHASFVKSPDGREDWALLHTARHQHGYFARCGRLLPVRWEDDAPVMKLPDSDLSIRLPSGEVVDRVLIQMEDGVLTEGAHVLEGLTKTPAVRFAEEGASATLGLSVPQAGLYALYVRYSYPLGETDRFHLRVNGAEEPIEVVAYQTGIRTEDSTHFTLACRLLTLKAGLNTVELTSGPQIAFDLAILDRTPME